MGARYIVDFIKLIHDADDATSRPPKTSRPSDSQKNKNKATSQATSKYTATAIKRTTANSNNVVVTRTSVAAAPKLKSKSKQVPVDDEPVVEMEDEDYSCEQEAALASPIKGSESRKMNKVCCVLSLLRQILNYLIRRRSNLNTTI